MRQAVMILGVVVAMTVASANTAEAGCHGRRPLRNAVRAVVSFPVRVVQRVHNRTCFRPLQRIRCGTTCTVGGGQASGVEKKDAPSTN